MLRRSSLGADVSSPAATSGSSAARHGSRGAAPHAVERLAPTIPSFDERAYLAWIEGHAPDDTSSRAAHDAGRVPLVRAPAALTEAFRFHDEPRRPRERGGDDLRPGRLTQGRSGGDSATVRPPGDEALSSASSALMFSGRRLPTQLPVCATSIESWRAQRRTPRATSASAPPSRTPKTMSTARSRPWPALPPERRSGGGQRRPMTAMYVSSESSVVSSCQPVPRRIPSSSSGETIG